MHIETFRHPIRVSDYPFRAGVRLNLAFLSDLHGCRNEPVLDVLATLKPDAVLVGGDVIHDAFHYQSGMEFLRRCAAAYPTFCSIGNHELLYPGDICAALRETGAAVLDNSFTDFHGIQIGGLSSTLRKQNDLPSLFRTRVPDVQWLSAFTQQTGFKILLSHHPEYFDPFLRTLPIDLVLSGHAHGGQWRAFGRGLFAPGQGFFPRYTAGLYHGRLLVSRGLGNASRIPRINNPPEIILLRLF